MRWYCYNLKLFIITAFVASLADVLKGSSRVPARGTRYAPLPRELRVCDSVGIFKKALKTFLFKKAYCWVKLRQTFLWTYVRHCSQDFENFIYFKLYFIFLGNFQFFICGLLRNKRYINKLLLLLLPLLLLLLHTYKKKTKKRITLLLSNLGWE